MKNIYLSTLLILLLSCVGKEEEVVLYTQYDPEYSDIQTFAKSECIEEATIFSVFDEKADFTNSVFEVGDIFKVVQDVTAPVVTYFKIVTMNASVMTVNVKSSSSSSYDMILTFSQSAHEDLVTFLENITCNNDAQEYFSTSGLTSSSQMSLNWSRDKIQLLDDDDNAEEYFYVDESLNISTSYPLFMYFFNGTKKHEYVQTSGTTPVTNTSTLTISEVTSTECSDDTTCAQIDSVTRVCEIEIDATVNGYLSQEPTYTPLDFTAASAVDCKFLESADIGFWDM